MGWRSLDQAMDRVLFVGQVCAGDEREGVQRTLLELAGVKPRAIEPGPAPDPAAARERNRERMRAVRAKETPKQAEQRRLRNRERMRAARASRDQIDLQSVPGSPAQRTVEEVIAELEAEAPGLTIDWLMRQRPG